MTRYGTIFSYWSRDWKTDWTQVLHNAAKSDINCIEFHVNQTMDWPESKIRDFVSLANDLDIEILMNGGVGENEVTYSDDPKIRQNGIDLITSYLKQAARFGAKFFDGGYSESWPVNPPAVINADLKKLYMDRVADSIKEMVKVAADLGITMGMEIVNRFEAFLVNTAKEARYIAERVDAPNFKVTMDTYHLNIEEDSIDEAVDTLGKKYIGHVHLGESNRRLPGQGTQVDWDKVFGGLKRIGYGERLLLEPFTIPFGTVGKSVFLWRDLSNGAGEEQLVREIKESIAFVKAKWEG